MDFKLSSWLDLWSQNSQGLHCQCNSSWCWKVVPRTRTNLVINWWIHLIMLLNFKINSILNWILGKKNNCINHLLKNTQLINPCLDVFCLYNHKKRGAYFSSNDLFFFVINLMVVFDRWGTQLGIVFVCGSSGELCENWEIYMSVPQACPLNGLVLKFHYYYFNL